MTTKKQTRKIYWKVLTDGRQSAFTSSTGAGVFSTLAGLHYPVEEWVKPRIKGSRIFIFECEESAVEFSHALMCLMVVPCHAQNVRRKGLCRGGYMIATDLENMKTFWKEWNMVKKSIINDWNSTCIIVSVPAGTVWATSIKCLK